MAKPWRELEKLVRDLERIFAGEQVEIRSPDFLQDRTNPAGKLREVDISLRRKVGSADILVIIECRRRGSPEDVTWIEQIATKAADVGASKAIAVSSKSFTSSAVSKAAAKNIELRTFAEVVESVALQWLGGIAYNYEIGNIQVVVKKSPNLGSLTGDAVVPSAESKIDQHMFVSLENGGEVSLIDLLPLKQVFWQAADDLPFGERQGFNASFAPTPGQLGVKTDLGVAEVADIRIEVTIERVLATPTMSSYQYKDQGGTVLAEGTQVTFDHYGVPVRVNFARYGEAQQQAGFTVRRDDFDSTRFYSYDFVFTGEDGQVRTASGTVPPSEKPARRARPEP